MVPARRRAAQGGLRPRGAVRPALEARVRARARVDGVVGIEQRLPQRDVELHGSGVAPGRARGAVQRAGHDGPPGARGPGPVLGQGHDHRAARRLTEHPDLVDRLVGAAAHELDGPVGADHQQTHPGARRLEHRGVEVGDRGARGHHHRHDPSRHGSEPDREEPRAALVDADVQPEPAVTVGGLEGDEQRGVARPRARDGVRHPRPDPLVDDDMGLRRRRDHDIEGRRAGPAPRAGAA